MIDETDRQCKKTQHTAAVCARSIKRKASGSENYFFRLRDGFQDLGVQNVQELRE
jgi:hypothetical protein